MIFATKSVLSNSTEIDVFIFYTFDWQPHIDGSVQERRNSIANALELHLSFTNPLI